MSEFIVQFKLSMQIGKDDWEIYTPTLKLTEDTTIRDIHLWYRKYIQHDKMELKLIEL